MEDILKNDISCISKEFYLWKFKSSLDHPWLKYFSNKGYILINLTLLLYDDVFVYTYATLDNTVNNLRRLTIIDI